MGLAEAVVGRDPLEVGEVALDQDRLRLEPAQLGPTQSQCLWVAIDTQETAAGPGGVQERPGVSARSQRAIDDARAGAAGEGGPKELYYLF